MRLIPELPTTPVRIIGSYVMLLGALSDPGKNEAKHAFERRLMYDIKEALICSCQIHVERLLMRVLRISSQDSF